MLRIASRQTRNVVGIARALKKSHPSISEQTTRLEAEGWIIKEKEGFIINKKKLLEFTVKKFSADKKTLEEIFDSVMAAVSQKDYNISIEGIAIGLKLTALAYGELKGEIVGKVKKALAAEQKKK